MAIQMRDPVTTQTRCSGFVEAGAVRLFQAGYLAKLRLTSRDAGVFRYTIPSESGRGSYEIEYDMEVGTITCTCPAGQHNVPCKHVRLFQLLHGWNVQEAGA